MTITNNMVAIPLDVGLLSKNFVDTNQFEMFIIDPDGKIKKQSTVTIPIAEESNTLGDWLMSLGVSKVFACKNDDDAHKILQEHKIEVINVEGEDNPEKIIWDYVNKR